MRGIVIAGLLLTSFGSTCAQADTQTHDGNGLYDVCSGTDATFTLGVCYGFIVGVENSMGGILICAPTNSTNKQAIDIVTMGLRDHPEERQKSASFLVIKYLSAAFPCAKK